MPEEVDRYQLDPLDGPAQMKDYLRNLERRIAELEGQRFVGSNLVMRDTAGDVRARVGRLTKAGGSGDVWGLEVVSQPGNADWPGGFPFFRATEDGAEFPYTTMAWVDSTLFKSVASATFVDVYSAGTGQILHVDVAAAVRVVTPAGTTGEVRLALAGGGAAGPAVTIPSATNTYIQIPAWAHGVPLWSGPVLFALQARRTGGAGTVDVYQTGYGLVFQPR